MVRTRFCWWMAIVWLMAADTAVAAVLEEGAVTVTQASIVVGFRDGTPSGDGTLRITPPSALSSGSLSVARGLPGGHMGRVFVEGGALNITSGGNIGESSIGRLEVTNGGIADFGKDLLVGGVFTSTPLAEGTIVVEGPGSRMRTGTRMIVGEYGLGEMYLADGAFVSPLFTTQSIAPASIVANRSGSVGNVFIEGDDTLWQHNGKIVVGNFGTGAAHITGGGNVISGGLSVGESIEGGQGSLGLGSVEIDGHGSRWTTPSLVIGDRGTGEVRVTNGGLLNVTNATQSQFQTTLGKQAGSFGRLIVSGPDSRWVDFRQAIVGDQGTGELWIEGGALVSNAGAIIGRSSTGNGLVVVRGEHTHWQAANISVGGQSRGALLTAGLLEILDGATVALGGISSEGLSIFSFGRVCLDRGTIAGASQKFITNSGGVLEGDGAVTGAIIINRQGGMVLVGEDQRLFLSAGLINELSGRVEVVAGELETGGTLRNNAQAMLIAEDATLRARGGDGLVNLGSVSLIGANRVYGRVTNNTTGVISLAAGGQTTFHNDVINNGQLKSATESHLRFAAALSGSGVSGPGSVRLDGAVQPGSTGVRSMNFGGDVTFGDFSALTIDVQDAVPGTGFDELNIAGDASLAGSLSLRILASLTSPTTLTILRADELAGTFAAVPALGANLGFGALFNGITYDYDQDVVRVSLLPGVTGDFNGDSSVDGTDFLMWQRHLGEAADPAGAGADGDASGWIDGGDLAVWTAIGGASQPVQAAVPEPIAAALVLVGLLGLGGRRVVGRGPLRL